MLVLRMPCLQMVNLYRDPKGENIVLTTHSSASKVGMKNLSTADLTERQNNNVIETRLQVSEMILAE